MTDWIDVRDAIARAITEDSGDQPPIGALDAVMAVVDPIVAERDTYRANGKEAAAIAFDVSEKLGAIEAELAETKAAHRAALLGLAPSGKPTYEALEEHVADLVQENGVLRGELGEARRLVDHWKSCHDYAIKREDKHRVRAMNAEYETVQLRARVADLEGQLAHAVSLRSDPASEAFRVRLEDDEPTPSDLRVAPSLGATPTEPGPDARVWARGAPQPDSVTHILERGERHWCLNRTDNLWYMRDIAGPTLSWDDLLEGCGWVVEVVATDVQ